MKAPGARWFLSVFLLAATTLNYLDRQTVGILAPRIQQEMGLDNEALGWLFSGFYYAYTVAQFGVGLLLDRGRVRLIYGIAVAGWSIAAALAALARDFRTLLELRILLGVMESANWPGAMRMVAQQFPPEERAFANGIFTSGTSIGAVVAPSLVLGIASAAGWRAAFVGLGLAGLVWVAVWISYTRRTTLPAVSPRTQGVPDVTATAPGLRFWRVFIITICVNPSLYFFLNWTPSYLAQQRGVSDSGTMALYLTAVYLALDLGNLSAGAAIYGLLRIGYTASAARRNVALSASAMALAAAAIPWVRGIHQALALMSCVTFALGMWVSLYLTFSQEVDAARVSTISGWLGGSGALAGAVAMWGVGRISARSGSFTVPLVAVSAACVAAAISACAGRRRIAV